MGSRLSLVSSRGGDVLNRIYKRGFGSMTTQPRLCLANRSFNNGKHSPIPPVANYSTKVDPNSYYGLLTNYGWFAIPRKYYATDWTIPQIHEKLKQTFPDIDTNPRSFEEIQLVIMEWSNGPKLSPKPKPTRITKADQRKLDELLLYKQQTKSLERAKAKEEKEVAKQSRKNEMKLKKEEKAKEKAQYYQYILKFGRIPETFDFNKISYTSAWNHFAAKHYNLENGDDTKQKRANLSIKWQAMTQDDKEQVRLEYIDLLKKGLSYEKGQLVPLKSKIKRLRYQFPR